VSSPAKMHFANQLKSGSSICCLCDEPDLVDCYDGEVASDVKGIMWFKAEYQRCIICARPAIPFKNECEDGIQNRKQKI
jgi:hypothetical protein